MSLDVSRSPVDFLQRSGVHAGLDWLREYEAWFESEGQRVSDAVDRAGTADFDKAEATGSALTLTKVDPPQRLRNMLPLDLSVVDFEP